MYLRTRQSIKSRIYLPSIESHPVSSEDQIRETTSRRLRMPPTLTVPSRNGTTDSRSSESLVSPKITALTEYNSLDPQPPHPSFDSIPKSFLLPDGYPDYLRLILTSRVYEITQETALTSAVNLSGKLGARVVMKREDLQPVFSFKIRGAYNKMAHIPEDDRWKGVVACSAGTISLDN
jgi:threonine dehydratase